MRVHSFPDWRTITVDLTKFPGQEFKLDLVKQANDGVQRVRLLGRRENHQRVSFLR